MRFCEYLKRLLRMPAAKKSRENAKRAKELADRLFPGEKWIKAEDGIYLSPRRAIGKKTNYREELRDAQILRDLGSTVYLVPENNRQPGRKFDAIVNSFKMEFKNMSGNGISTLQEHFFTSRMQAPNVFINLEKSTLTKHQVISALYGARNNIKRYSSKNCFSDGKIILKIREQMNFIYLDVNDLEV